MRFGVSGRGRRGGVRVIHFFGSGRMPICALLAYSKSDTTDLTPGERRAVAKLADSIKRQGRQRK